jgi:fructan beta-fructosidase
MQCASRSGFLAFLLAAAILAPAARLFAAQEDLLIADFEGTTYGAWKVTGDAFGPGPAPGTLAHQMPVSGYLGKGLVSSFYHGDQGTGTLTSPEFTIQRKFITFLIGGGFHPGKACINLLVGGKPVRTATGPNKKPGGTERLEPADWDVSAWLGSRAQIQIVDQVTGPWGHINIDHIVQTNTPPPRFLSDVEREITVEKRYLCLPIHRDAARRHVGVHCGQQTLLGCDIDLADAQPDAWANLDLDAARGRKVTLRVDRLLDNSTFFSLVQQADAPCEPDHLYHERYRPQFHFTPRTNWTNDPNGLVFYKGQYHLFFQHNPYGLNWGNMTWGHAVSPDLVHWQQWDDAIAPDRLGTIFSGSAVVDVNNTAGFQTGAEKAIVCVYTSAGGTSPESAGQPFSQSLAYSNDGGRTWKKYEHNPVLPHIVGSNRDPKLVWFEPTRRWILALYKEKHDYGLFSSRNLKSWTHLHDITVPGSGECPDFFEMPLDGKKQLRKWVFVSAKGDYVVGSFDGQRFTPETGPHSLHWPGGNYYAVQTYSDIPPADGRRIQIAWMNGGRYPDMPFNQQMSFPCELTLRTGPDGLRLYRYPVREIELLRGKTQAWSNLALAPGKNLLGDLCGELFDVEAEIAAGAAKEVAFSIWGHKLAYEPEAQKLVSYWPAGKKSSGVQKMDLAPIGGRIKLRILVDRASVEVFANDGRVAASLCFLPAEGSKPLELSCDGGTAKIISLKVHELKSAW